MIQATFQHRSGRVIALGRLVLAAVFLLAIWFDPTQPNQQPEVAYALLGLYVGWSAVLLVLTWSNWWYDYRLADRAHFVDLGVFGIIVFFTEGYTSPFYTFFVFLLLSSAIRRSWRDTALTAVAVLVLFVTAGMAVFLLGNAELDLYRLLVRSVYLVVLSLLFIWFGINQQSQQPTAASAAPDLPLDADVPPVEAALRLARERLRAPRLVLAWWHDEEPWLNAAELDGQDFRREQFAPDRFGPLVSDRTGDASFLFDLRRGRTLARNPADPYRPLEIRQRIDPAFAERFRLDNGLAVGIRSRDYQGELFALAIDGLCLDDLKTAQRLGADIAASFDRSSMVAVSEEAAVTRAKTSLARDLHDSVIQALSGAAFRLEALKSWIKAGEDPGPEIDTVKAELAAEQRNIRAFIATLRGGRGSTRTTDLSSGLPYVAEELRQRWNLNCELDGETAVRGPLWMEHEIHQIIREAAANAVRHGGATRLSIAMTAADGHLDLSIADNGAGLGEGAREKAGEGARSSPKSVQERAHGLGGSFSLVSSTEGCRLDIQVPLVDAA